MRGRMRAKFLKKLAIFSLVVSLIVPTGFSFAEDKIYSFSNINNGSGTKVADHLEKAKEQGANILYMTSAPRGTIGNVDFTPEFKEFSYKRANGTNYSGTSSVATLGWMAKDLFTIKSWTNITIKNIEFYKQRYKEGAYVVIEEGAAVHFKNVSFSNTVVNNGTAIFEDVTFSTGDIKNNGQAVYTGKTVEPKNIGTPKPQHIPLTLSITGGNLFGEKGKSLDKEISFELIGSNKDQATKTVNVSPENAGVVAEVVENRIKVTGTPTQTGNYSVTLRASFGDEVQEKSVSITVLKNIEIKIDGEIPGFAQGQEASEVDTISGASGAGASMSDAQKSLKVMIKEGDAKFVELGEFAKNNLWINPEMVSYNLSPEGSGIGVISPLIGYASLSGKANDVGKYELRATFNDGVRQAVSAPVSFQVYDMNVSFADRLAGVPSSVKYWMMDPFKIPNTTGGATIPLHIKGIYGSNEAGLYGEIGHNQSGVNYGQDVITIPAGADVKIVNMMLYSSVRIVVEKGAKLTIQGSKVFSPIDVYGTLEVSYGKDFFGNDIKTTSVMNTITMHDGSTLAPSKIQALLLTDGNSAADTNIKTLLDVRGNVTVEGASGIKALYGDGASKGQTAIKITNGTLTLADGASLEAYGGGDETMVFSPYGGDAIELDNGHIVGRNARLIAYGGIGHTKNGSGGHGVAGNGTLDVGTIVAHGGDGAREEIIFGTGRGGDSIQTSVEILNLDDTNLTEKAGKGKPDGKIYRKVEPTDPATPTDPSNGDNGGTTPTDPTNPTDPSNGNGGGTNPSDPSNGNNGGTNPTDPSNGNNGGSNNNPYQPTPEQPSNPPAPPTFDSGSSGGGSSYSPVRPDPVRNAETIEPNKTPTAQAPESKDEKNQNADQANANNSAENSNQNSSAQNSIVNEAGESKFRDLPTTHWAFGAVAETIAKGYYVGASATTFSPNRHLNRAEFITILGRVLKAETTPDKNVYSDVKASDYFVGYANWAFDKGYYVGVGNKFVPSEKMTREQMAVIIAKVLQEKTSLTAEPTKYKDANKISSEAKESVDLVSTAGILSGYANGNFGAKDYLTRAQMATIALRIDKALEK